MTLKELWMLFPIVLEEHTLGYEKWYEIEWQNEAYMDPEMLYEDSIPYPV